jgi:filamentous hemagglutinin family protein
MASHAHTAPPLSGLTRLLTFSSVLWLVALLTVSHAQLTLDGSLGPRGPLPGPHYHIGAELGQIRGGNLFHSFGAFNVPTGGSATFTGPNTIANIVGRVTGGQPSAIDGLLRSEIAGAHLYLLNPSGVLFGPNASLDVSGSFHVSTADFLRFADGAKFFATLGQESVLTVAPPAAFGFLGSNPAGITIQGSTLQVPTGKALSVVGGDLEIAGQRPLSVGIGGEFDEARVPTLGAPSGRISLVSVAARGEVHFTPMTLARDLEVDSLTHLGRIALTQGATLKADGHGGGSILLRGGHLLVDNAALWANNLGDVDGTGIGVDLRVVADATITSSSAIMTHGVGAGRARDLQITAGSLHINHASFIGSRPFASGGGGDLRIVATDIITIAGQARISTSAFPYGGAGQIVVSAPLFSITGGGRIEATTGGSSNGNAGLIEVRVGTLTLTGGASISTSTSGAGRGGRVTVTASEAIVIAGRNSAGEPSRLSVNAYSEGPAGDIIVTTPRLSIDGGTIRAGTAGEGPAGTGEVEVGTLTLTGGGTISTSTSGAGPGGTLTVTAREAIVIAGQNQETTSNVIAGQNQETTPSGLVSMTQGQGQGGNLQISAKRIELRDSGSITASSAGDGPAGTLRIQASEAIHSQHGVVATAATRAGGGEIKLRAGHLVQLQDSEITTSVRGGGGDAGNLTLESPLVIAEGSQMVANAFEGIGGNIRIGAEVFLADPASLVSASSALGLQGTVNIQAPVTSLSGTLAPLPQAFVQVAALLPARCAARLSGGQTSSLVVGGRDGLPREPGSLLPSPLVLEERLAADPAVIGAPHQQTSTAKFALLAAHEKGLPRLGCPQ